MSLACRILKSAALQVALATKDLRNYRDQVNYLEGAALGRRDGAIIILKTHLNDCPKRVRKEVGQAIRKYLNLGGAA